MSEIIKPQTNIDSLKEGNEAQRRHYMSQMTMEANNRNKNQKYQKHVHANDIMAQKRKPLKSNQ